MFHKRQKREIQTGKKTRTAALVVEKMKNEERTDKHGSKELQKFSLTSLKQSLCVSIKSWSCCEFQPNRIKKISFLFFLLRFSFQFCQYTFILTQYESFSSSTLVFFFLFLLLLVLLLLFFVFQWQSDVFEQKRQTGPLCLFKPKTKTTETIKFTSFGKTISSIYLTNLKQCTHCTLYGQTVYSVH